MNKKIKVSKKLLALITCALLLCLSVFLFLRIFLATISAPDTKPNENDSRSYHIIVTGTYENQLFMEKVYEGALKEAANHSAVVEMYVPEAQASNLSLQDLLDYCVYVNADGVIAYIDSPDEKITMLTRSEGYEIPLVTTGQFSPEVQQISFIGSGYWELGKKVADEILNLILTDNNQVPECQVYVINDFLSANSNYNNLINSMQTTLHSYPDIETTVLKNLEDDFILENAASSVKNIFVCLSEDSTIRTAQILNDSFKGSDYKVIGFGSNEACQIFLEKNLVSELISLDPEKIGQAAMTELFEYRNKGYANSYIAADIKVTKAPQ